MITPPSKNVNAGNAQVNAFRPGHTIGRGPNCKAKDVLVDDMGSRGIRLTFILHENAQLSFIVTNAQAVHDLQIAARLGLANLLSRRGVAL